MAVGGSTCGAKMGGKSNGEAKAAGGAKKAVAKAKPAAKAKAVAKPKAKAGGGAKKAAKKRAPSPYNKFYKAKYPVMKAKFPNLSAPEIMKKVAAEWQLQKK
jgi:hypothetical protein